MVKLGALSLKGPKGQRGVLGGVRHRADKEQVGGNGQGLWTGWVLGGRVTGGQGREPRSRDWSNPNWSNLAGGGGRRPGGGGGRLRAWRAR